MKPRISIITVNLNDKDGLEKTIKSVVDQSFKDYEFIVVDGASTDGSLKVIEKYKSSIHKLVSEPDSGIFNAMNKGIRMANGDYCYFLNSNDAFANKDVLKIIFEEVQDQPPFICGHQLNDYGDHVGIVKAKNRLLNLSDFYTGTIKHQATFIRRDLFDKYGLYDESLRITADWKFFIETIGLHNEQPRFVDIDIVLFAWFGISTDISYQQKHEDERLLVINELISPSIQRDLDRLEELNHYTYIGDLMKKNKIFKFIVKASSKLLK